MSQENVEIVRRWWASLEAGELPFDLTDENVRIDNIDQPVVKGAFHGHDGLRRWWEDFTESLADIHHEVLDSTALDAQQVLAEIRSQGHFRETGLPIDLRWASIFWVRNGKVVHAAGYLSAREALEAVGLSEQPLPQENVAAVNRAISAINDRDVDAYLAVCRPDVELISPVAAIEGSNRGEAGVRSFFDGIREATTRFQLEVERLLPLSDDRVLAFLTLNLETERGFPQRQSLTNLYELEGGKLLRIRVFRDRHEALEAPGPSEQDAHADSS